MESPSLVLSDKLAVPPYYASRPGAGGFHQKSLSVRRHAATLVSPVHSAPASTLATETERSSLPSPRSEPSRSRDGTEPEEQLKLADRGSRRRPPPNLRIDSSLPGALAAGQAVAAPPTSHSAKSTSSTVSAHSAASSRLSPRAGVAGSVASTGSASSTGSGAMVRTQPKSAKDIMYGLAVHCVSPGLPSLNHEMMETVMWSKSIEQQQRKLIAARQKSTDEPAKEPFSPSAGRQLKRGLDERSEPSPKLRQTEPGVSTPGARASPAQSETEITAAAGRNTKEEAVAVSDEDTVDEADADDGDESEGVEDDSPTAERAENALKGQQASMRAGQHGAGLAETNSQKTSKTTGQGASQPTKQPGQQLGLLASALGTKEGAQAEAAVESARASRTDAADGPAAEAVSEGSRGAPEMMVQAAVAAGGRGRLPTKRRAPPANIQIVNSHQYRLSGYERAIHSAPIRHSAPPDVRQMQRRANHQSSLSVDASRRGSPTEDEVARERAYRGDDEQDDYDDDDDDRDMPHGNSMNKSNDHAPCTSNYNRRRMNKGHPTRHSISVSSPISKRLDRAPTGRTVPQIMDVFPDDTIRPAPQTARPILSAGGTPVVPPPYQDSRSSSSSSGSAPGTQRFVPTHMRSGSDMGPSRDTGARPGGHFRRESLPRAREREMFGGDRRAEMMAMVFGETLGGESDLVERKRKLYASSAAEGRQRDGDEALKRLRLLQQRSPPLSSPLSAGRPQDTVTEPEVHARAKRARFLELCGELWDLMR
ncbi:uncharacterized protein V1510DRAFT_242397 [Dipodascopsis tothii]|uniref:uncharacterized protein n=1 Tax=Dipodascopsis tothii TaxID=44089 RepID=UPI0034CEF2F2